MEFFFTISGFLALFLSCGVIQIQVSAMPTTVSPPGEPVWSPPDGRSRADWMRTSGQSEEDWKRTQQLMTSLHDMITSEDNIPREDALHKIIKAVKPNITDEEPCALMTLEQAQLLTDEYLRKQEEETDTSAHERRKRKLDVRKLTYKWQMPIKYKFDGGHSEYQRSTIRHAADHWMQRTCVRFEEVSTSYQSNDNHIIITKNNPGCYSYVGKVGVIPQPINLHAPCLTEFGVPVHEFGHALGLWHEQQRSDRDDHIRVNKHNLGSYTSQFYKRSTENLQVPYDFGSVMHYSPLAGSKNGLPTMESLDSEYQSTMGQRTGLSYLDAKIINLHYCSDTCDESALSGVTCKHGGYQDYADCSRCICPDGLAGRYCEDLAPPVNASCGGDLNLSPGSGPEYITSPGYDSGRYEQYQQCNWRIQAPSGYNIIMEFEEDFGIYCSQARCYHWLEMRYKKDLGAAGPRFCCYNRPSKVYTAERGEAMLLFRSHFDVPWRSARRGFKVKVTVEPKIVAVESTPSTTTRRTTTASTTTSTTTTLTSPTTTTTTTTTKHTSPTTTRTTTTGATTQTTTPTLTTTKTTPPATTTTEKITTTTEKSSSTAHSGDCSKMDIAFLLDSSGSVGEDGWMDTLTFTSSMVEHFTLGSEKTRVGVVSIGTRGYLQIHFDDHSRASTLQSAIMDLPFRDQWTHTTNALNVASNMLFEGEGRDKDVVRRVVILVTDGKDNRASASDIEQATSTAKNSGLQVYVIGVGDEVDMNQASIFSGSRDRIMEYSTYNQLTQASVVKEIYGKICDDNEDTDSDSGENTDGGTADSDDWQCNFEDIQNEMTLCQMTQAQNDDFDWTLKSGPTKSRKTGPSEAESGDFYIYTEASKPRQLGDQATILVPGDSRRGDYCISFYYNMHGFHIGSLELVIIGDEKRVLWSRKGQHGDMWLYEAQTVNMQNGEVIGFRGTRGKEYSGDIALDTISVAEGSCQFRDEIAMDESEDDVSYGERVEGGSETSGAATKSISLQCVVMLISYLVISLRLLSF